MAIPFENTLSASGNGSLRTGWWLTGTGAAIILVWGFVAFSIGLPVTVSSADGRTVSATESLDITSTSDAPISSLPYQLGDAVAPGDVLITFDTEPLRLELTRSRERLAALRQEIDSIDLEIASTADSLTGELDSYDMAIEALAARTEETEAELRYAQRSGSAVSAVPRRAADRRIAVRACTHRGGADRAAAAGSGSGVQRAAGQQAPRHEQE